ncbi:MAG: prenyltransferase/squalene oxidase repeat-containing protein [Oscillochloridaceae bacterium umkhey_bin13]
MARLRFTTSVRRRFTLLLALIVFTLSFAPLAQAQTSTPGLAGAVNWMRNAQQADGSFPGFGPGDTADAVIGLVAAGEPLAQFARGDNTPISFLQSQAATYAASGPGGAAKLVMAAVAAGEDPTSFGGVNLLQLIGASYDPATGQYGADVFGHALALLAFKAVETPAPNAAIGRLLDLQLADGGWSFDGAEATGSDTNTTGLVLQALAGLRQADGARARALRYLEGQQNADGGFPYSQSSPFGNASDANSTATVLLGLKAAGEDLSSARWAKGAGIAAALAGFQNPSGAFRYQLALPDDNALATYGAVPAMVETPLPVRTTAIAGASALLVPAAPVAAPVTLPATGGPMLGLIGLAVAGLLMTLGGLVLRRAGR